MLRKWDSGAQPSCTLCGGMGEGTVPSFPCPSPSTVGGGPEPSPLQLQHSGEWDPPPRTLAGQNGRVKTVDSGYSKHVLREERGMVMVARERCSPAPLLTPPCYQMQQGK